MYSSTVDVVSDMFIDQKPLLYADNKGAGPRNHTRDRTAKGRIAGPLRAWFWIPLVIFMMLGAIGLEIALHYSKVNLGWATIYSMKVAPDSAFANYYHYAYTTPPVLAAMIIVGLWTGIALEIQAMQPYIELMRGHASAKKSLLLDYPRENKFLRCISAFANRHYSVAVISLAAVVALILQPLAASIFILKDTWWGPKPFYTTNLFSIGLNQGSDYLDLTAFLSAAGYASSSALYNLSEPAFVYDVYTVAPFEIPSTNGGFNGTVNTNTTAIKTETNCYPMATQSTQISNGSWVNAATLSGCIYYFTVTPTANNAFGADVMPDCNNTGAPPHFRPIVFWFFTNNITPPQGAATFCAPTISLLEVSTTLEINNNSLTSVLEIQPINSSTSSLSQNVTGPPMNGQAFNGISFNLTNPDELTIRKSNATTLQLSDSILQVVAKAPGGLQAAFHNNNFTDTATMVYGTYLMQLAKTIYFLPTTSPILVEVNSFQRRLWLSDVAVHCMAVILIVVAVAGLFVQIFHRRSRQKLRLQHTPGTIASAISFSAGPNLVKLLNNHDDTDADALGGRHFRIDPRTMQILMEEDDGYEEAVSPTPRRPISPSQVAP